MESRTTARGQLRRRRTSIAGREICQLWWLEAVGLAEAARNGYKEKTFLNSTRPSDLMASFDSEIPEAQLASGSACCES